MIRKKTNEAELKEIFDLNRDILNVTMEIHKNHSELSKFIEEMPITIPNQEKPSITIDNLKKYLDSLVTLLVDYELEKEDVFK